jgi:hypothetical protein
MKRKYRPPQDWRERQLSAIHALDKLTDDEAAIVESMAYELTENSANCGRDTGLEILAAIGQLINEMEAQGDVLP